uniref:Uncharacterized protein n=1 Tax=viral metagenome TaxID=1070528 RepID=A0A6M3LE88_9ZZZZ
MEVESIRIRRVGVENDPHAVVVLELQDIHGEWREIGREQLSGNFCTAWNLPQCLYENTA